MAEVQTMPSGAVGLGTTASIPERPEPEQEVKTFQAKLYLNGYPKAGLHMIEQMARELAGPSPQTPMFRRAWCGTFRFNSWTRTWVNKRQYLFKASSLRPGFYYLGHVGHNAELAEFLYLCGISMVFVYRDLRDVAISQAHHVLHEDNTRFQHAGKADYHALGSFEETLIAVIRGLGRWPGLIERWADYAAWLDESWVLSVRFEDARYKPEETASAMLRYTLGHTAGIYGFDVTIPAEQHDLLVERMVANAAQRDRSPTFRRGESGGWRDHFTPAVRAAFAEAGGNEVLIALGYETNDRW